MSTVLTIVHWYTHDATYLGDQLVHWGEAARDASALLAALGYDIRARLEIPTHHLAAEYDREPMGWWRPPTSLRVLEQQMAAVAKREKRERIERLRGELKRLEEDA